MCDALYGRIQLWLMQDGAPAHQARVTMDALSRVVRIPPGWPADRCALNPIEVHWSVMGGQLAVVEWTSTAEVFRRLQAIWDALDVGVINRLVADFPRRLLVQVNGNSSSPFAIVAHRERCVFDQARSRSSWRRGMPR
jgi:hypothetical protein